ncbi:HAUS augmin-like complex subunit 7 isoform X3 [Podarcis raffonei]|uniref:HAUS augmin-like complex subunit 7 isoform X3 n=1 Tax=Podarcis raffonei TaxID=65483 RepID=UPI0023295598|nr:HAUS augmin-like complex subunit 7 isoform X3 [Podarcis raffonei]
MQTLRNLVLKDPDIFLCKELGCPALDGVYLSEAKDIQKLLCAPSPHRLDILEWICGSVSPAHRKQLSSLGESQSDLKIKAMANLGYHLMLCRANDLDLIEGKVSAQEQLHFLEQLVAVIPAQALRSLLSVTSHEETLLEASKELEEVVAALQDLRKECSFLHGDPAGADASSVHATALQTLRLMASDFSQLLVAFSQVYERQLQQHCERPAPVLSCLGPFVQEVHLGLQLCVQELQALLQVKETSECIVNTVKQKEQGKRFWSGSSKATLSSKLEELQQKYKAIHAALKKCQQP